MILTMERKHKIINFILNTVLFAGILAIASTFVVDSYYRYFDKTEYYEIHSITTSKNNYKACETIKTNIEREALTDLTGDFTVVLSLESSLSEPIASINQKASISKGISTVINSFPIPCLRKDSTPLSEGQYKLKVELVYQVRGIQKIESADSNLFTIKP